MTSASAPFLSFTLLRSTRAPASAYQARDLEALAAFVLRREAVAGPSELTLDLTTHARIQVLNRRFRGVDRTTDVIAFRYEKRPRLQGDIAINITQAALQAEKVGHSWAREIRLLLIHGTLHLLDYTDYEPRPRRRMFKRQNELLRQWEKRDQ